MDLSLRELCIDTQAHTQTGVFPSIYLQIMHPCDKGMFSVRQKMSIWLFFSLRF